MRGVFFFLICSFFSTTYNPKLFLHVNEPVNAWADRYTSRCREQTLRNEASHSRFRGSVLSSAPKVAFQVWVTDGRKNCLFNESTRWLALCCAEWRLCFRLPCNSCNCPRLTSHYWPFKDTGSVYYTMFLNGAKNSLIGISWLLKWSHVKSALLNNRLKLGFTRCIKSQKTNLWHCLPSVCSCLRRLRSSHSRKRGLMPNLH